MTNTPTTLLIAGHYDLIKSAAFKIIKEIYCTYNNTEPCNNCTACISINSGTHHAQTILKPEKRYTLDDLELIFKKSSFKLDNNEYYFFIIHQADLLSPSCANTLLKLIEEPPKGYHFFFLTERFLSVLPTIRSRCTIKIIRDNPPINYKSFLDHFSSKTTTNVLAFQKELFEKPPSEDETITLIDQLLQKFIDHYKETIEQKYSTGDFYNNQDTLCTLRKKILFLQKALLQLPMPGSSRIFWKNFYLQIHSS